VAVIASKTRGRGLGRGLAPPQNKNSNSNYSNIYDFSNIYEEGPGRGRSPPRPLFAVPNVTAHPSTASVPVSK